METRYYSKKELSGNYFYTEFKDEDGRRFFVEDKSRPVSQVCKNHSYGDEMLDYFISESRNGGGSREEMLDKIKVKIEYFKDNISLGAFACPQGSNNNVRRRIAEMNGIKKYDKIVLDDGRVTMFVNQRKREWKAICKPSKEYGASPDQPDIERLLPIKKAKGVK